VDESTWHKDASCFAACVCVCKSNFIVTELLELIPLRGTAAGEYIVVREFTKDVMILPLTEVVGFVTVGALVVRSIERCLVGKKRTRSSVV